MDTQNDFGVTAVSDGGIAVLRAPRRPITKEQALRLAAYLVILTGATDDEWNAMRTAVESA